ncbi:hypothetical protein NBRC116493_23440 [Aurantivibrio infirmus]
MKLEKLFLITLFSGFSLVALSACGSGSGGSADGVVADPSPVAEIPVSDSGPGNEAAVEMEFNPFVKQLAQVDLQSDEVVDREPEEMNTQVWIFDDSEDAFSDLFEE